MAYEGKFVDTSPDLKAAGQVTFRKEENVVGCLEHEITEEETVPFVCKTEPLDYKLPLKRTNIYKGFYSDVRECLQPEKNKGLFDVLKREFQETVYDSYWKKEVGRVPDPSPMLPAGMDPMKICFGKATPALSTAGEIINPPKLYPDVIEESRVGHNMYIRTHQDYDPGEQVRRDYVKPFNRELIYGVNTPSDPEGGCIQKVMNTEVNDKIFVSKILADHKKRVTPLVGKVHAPNNNITCVPKGHAFGRLNKRDLFGAGELLKNSIPSSDKIELHDQMSYINVLRQQIAKKEPLFPHRDFIDELHKMDFNNKGLIPLPEAYKVLAEFEIFPDQSTFEGLLLRLNILTPEKMVAYEKMADLLNKNIMFVDIKKIDDVPSEFLSFETTSQEAYKYHYSPEAIKNTKDILKAGIPPQKYISMDSLVSPANFSHYFLEPTDFFVSRSPEYLQKLFSRLGCEMAQEKFNMVWNNAQDKRGCVSVHSFLKALKDCT